VINLKQHVCVYFRSILDMQQGHRTVGSIVTKREHKRLGIDWKKVYSLNWITILESWTSDHHMINW
jgi:hypothetical protein